MTVRHALRRCAAAVRELGYYHSSFGLRGVVAAVREKIERQNALYEVEHPSIRFRFFLRLGTSDIKTYEQVFVQDLYEFAFHKKPKVIVDAGANIGLVSIVYANRFPNARIVAIEPEENNYRMLQKNTAAYKNIIPLKAALWDTNERVNLVDPGLGEWGFRTRRNTDEGSNFTLNQKEVQGLTLDRIMEKFGLAVIDILKIDIEGAEREVFRDPSLWIDRVNLLVVELHDRFAEECSHRVRNAMKHFDAEWRQGGNYIAIREKFRIPAD